MDTLPDLNPIGHVRSPLKDRTGAPKQPYDGGPAATLEIDPAFAEALEGLQPGHEIWILTWLHHSRRDTLRVHPRGMPGSQLFGVFATRSPDRPNPIGLHRTRILAIEGVRIRVEALEAIDGTPILDLKPVQIRDPH